MFPPQCPFCHAFANRSRSSGEKNREAERLLLVLLRIPEDSQGRAVEGGDPGGGVRLEDREGEQVDQLPVFGLAFPERSFRLFQLAEELRIGDRPGDLFTDPFRDAQIPSL